MLSRLSPRASPVSRVSGPRPLSRKLKSVSTRPSAPEKAIQAVMSDPSWFVRVVQEKLFEIRAGSQHRPGLELLSPRERQVLEQLASGKNNDAIARELGLSVQTVRNNVAAAETRVMAGRASLRGSESSLFSQVTAAYMDVIQNEAIVGLTRNNLNVLDVNLQATSDRFEIGDLTRTDVAQSASRRALAQSDVQTAEANLIRSRENYIQLVGTAPDNLQPPPPLPGLPASVDDAVATALEHNPDLQAAKERAARLGT